MSKYIKISDATDVIEKYRAEYATRRLNEHPSIDLIKCGQCKYWIKAQDSKYYQPMYFCAKYLMTTHYDGYCAWGEKKDNVDKSTRETQQQKNRDSDSEHCICNSQ